jgi:hypothetical protein
MNDQPEALRVADETQRCFPKSGKKAARLLREQHEEIARQREAVTKYGRHLDGCVVMLGGYQCTCGFNQQGGKP